MDLPGSTNYEKKMKQNRILRELRSWYCIYMEDREKSHRDRVRLKQNNMMLKALIKHHKIDMPVLAGSEEEWSDLGEEGDVFATDDDEGVVQSPAAAAATTNHEAATTTDGELGDEDGDDPSF
jgi:hypothetical protein